MLAAGSFDHVNGVPLYGTYAIEGMSKAEDSIAQTSKALACAKAVFTKRNFQSLGVFLIATAILGTAVALPLIKFAGLSVAAALGASYGGAGLLFLAVGRSQIKAMKEEILQEYKDALEGVDASPAVLLSGRPVYYPPPAWHAVLLPQDGSL